MLLIYNRESKIAENNIVFKQGMCSNKYADRTIFNALVHLASFSCLAASCKKSRADTCRSQKFLDVLKVLLCKHFCWRHYAGLVSIANSDKCAQKSYHSLSATHITLQKTVHLMAALEVVSYLCDHTFLCTCQREGE